VAVVALAVVRACRLLDQREMAIMNCLAAMMFLGLAIPVVLAYMPTR